MSFGRLRILGARLFGTYVTLMVLRESVRVSEWTGLTFVLRRKWISVLRLLVLRLSASRSCGVRLGVTVC